MKQPPGQSGPPPDEAGSRVVRFELSLGTIVAVLLAAGAVWALIRLLPVVLVLILALIIVGTMNPAVHWLKARGAKRGPAIAIVFSSFVVVFLLIITLTIPELVSQATNLLDQEPALRARLAGYLAESRLTISFAEALRNVRYDALAKYLAETALTYSGRIVEVVGYGFSAIFLALYLMLDRDRIRGGLFSVVPRAYHLRLSRVMMNMETIVGGYIRGQAITSVLMAAFTYILLTACRVPNPLAIAVFAGVADVLPYIGIILSVVPAILAALSVSPVVALIVLVLMLVYGEIESRVLMPRIYGRVLRLPSSIVLLSILIGGSLFGIVGVFLSLPLAAAVRMIIEELRVALPGEPGLWNDELRRRDDHAEQEYRRRASDMPAAQAAAIAVEISRKRRQGEDLPPAAPIAPVKTEKSAD